MPEGTAVDTTSQPAGGDQTTTTTTPQSTAGTTQPQTTPSSAQRQDPAPGQNSGNDARDRGLIADLQRERTTRQTLERELARLQAESGINQRRIQALAGVAPQSDEDAQAEQIRAAFIKLFPWAGKLTEESVDAMIASAQQGEAMQQTVAQHWENHGRQMLDALAAEVTDSLGGSLSDRQRKALANAYIARAEEDPEFLKRHNRGDRALVKEFAKEWMEDWFEPARRSATAQAVNQGRPAPRGRDRSVQTTPPAQINFKDPKAVEDAMVDSFRKHGGSFDK